MNVQRDAADRLLTDLIKQASRADAAEAELNALKQRIEVFTVEERWNSFDAPERAVHEIIERTVARKLASALMDHHHGNQYLKRASAVARRTMPDGAKRFIIKVILEPEGQTSTALDEPPEAA